VRLDWHIRHTDRSTIHITDAIVLDEGEIKGRFVRATGPGQNVNKDANAVELRVDLWRSSLPAD